MLSSVLVNESTPLHVRNAAGLALKNALTARVRLHHPLKMPTYLTLFFFTSILGGCTADGLLQ